MAVQLVRWGRVSPEVAFVLQCIPLPFAATWVYFGLALSGMFGDAWLPPGPLVWVALVSGLLWGVGYAYAGRWERFLLAFFAMGCASPVCLLIVAGDALVRSFDMLRIGPPAAPASPDPRVVLGVGGAVFACAALGMAWDAYRFARRDR
jgi:hypothetical protein